MALNYGSKKEIVLAANKAMKKLKNDGDLQSSIADMNRHAKKLKDDIKNSKNILEDIMNFALSDDFSY